ncbi:MAG: multicopper oxidase family protein [Janthinobacterium lividum]
MHRTAHLIKALTLSSLIASSASVQAIEQSFVDLSDRDAAVYENMWARHAGGPPPGFDTGRCAASVNPSGRSTSLTLDVQYGSYKIYNPSTGAYDTVSMRGYNGCPAGPTVSINPGASLQVNLKNDLPTESVATCPTTVSHTTPHCFNTVNLHTHGLHVSPSGHSDNVLVSVPPGSSYQYRYDLPADHPAGTFWYHSHRHGSTAIDVSSGMEGVLIVRGSRTAAARAQNDNIADIDTILHQPRTNVPFREHVFLFQQIEYGCFSNASATAPLADATSFEWVCPGGKVGELRNYTGQLNFIADPRPGYTGAFNSTWTISGRYTQINGVVQPVFPDAVSVIPAGEIRRLRLVHGGNRDSINFKIVKADLAALGVGGGVIGTAQMDVATRTATSLLRGKPTIAQQATTLDKICNGEVVEQEEIAVDGLTRSAVAEKAVVSLSPGYRSDVLVAFPSPGLYCILDEAADASTTVNYRPGASKVKDRRLLSFARVGPGTLIPEYPVDGVGHTKYWQYLRNQLLAANANLPSDVSADLRNLNLRTFAAKKPLTGVVNQTVTRLFNIDVTTGTLQYVINGKSYDPDRIDYTATLGTVDEWRVTASAGGHIFHIHVNPFQVTDILNSAGTSIYDTTGACTATEIATGDTQYCALHGVFLDTLFIKSGYTAVLRTKYEDYTGEFVMHCHILDHEDQGMMENVSIVSPQTALVRKIAGPVVAATTRAEDRMRALLGLPRKQAGLFVNGFLNAPICGPGLLKTKASLEVW